jgi:hypothetical protein
MTKLIYEIARPFCGYHEVTRETFNNPPQLKGSPEVIYRKRILVEATPEQIEEAEKTDGND